MTNAEHSFGAPLRRIRLGMCRNCHEVDRRHMFERQSALTESKEFIRMHPKRLSDAALTLPLQVKQDSIRHSSLAQ
jgi:hypothetical protein